MKKQIIAVISIMITISSLAACGKKNSEDNTISLPDSYDWGENVVTDFPDDAIVELPQSQEFNEAEFIELQNDPNNDANVARNSVQDIMDTDEFKSVGNDDRATIIREELERCAEEGYDGNGAVGKILPETISYDSELGIFTYVCEDGSYGIIEVDLLEIDEATGEYIFPDTNDEPTIDDSQAGGWVR